MLYLMLLECSTAQYTFALQHNTHLRPDCSTAQYTFKSISADLTKKNLNDPKNEEKDSNSLNTSLFTLTFFLFSYSAHASNVPKWV